MEIEISELIAFFSLVVAFVAYRHSVESSNSTRKQIQKIADTHLRLSSNIALNDASQKYVSLLNEVNTRFEEIADNLAVSALEACTNIGSTFDQFDTEEVAHPNLRHAYHKCITLVREAYDKELIYQTGRNLTWRIGALRSIKDDVVSYKKTKAKKSIFTFLKIHHRPETPEDIINTTTFFWDSIETIYTRIPENKETDLFRQTSMHLREYSKLHNENKEELEQLERRLENAIKENNLEMFDIEEIPSLGQKLYRVKGDIGRFRQFHFPDYYEREDIPILEGVAYSVYMGSILYIVSQHFMWGKI